MNPITSMDPSTRRLVFGFLTPVLTLLLNNKMGLGLSEEQLADLINLAMMYLGASNLKDAAVAFATRKGTEAAAVVKTPDDADKQIGKALGLLLVGSLLFAPATTHAQDAGVIQLVEGQPTTRPVPDVPKLVVLSAGQPAPADGRWVSNDSWVKLAQRDAQLEAENDALKSKVTWPVWVPIVALVVGAGAGVGITYGVLSRRP